jgi:hypothetical protein
VERPRGFSVEPHLGSTPFVTPDRTLAEQVAREWDAREPLPIPEHDCSEDTYAVGSWASAEPIAVRCTLCGAPIPD